MIVSVCLSKGALAMSRKKGHVKRPQLDPELRRHERALHRQDRHVDHGPRHPRNLLRRLQERKRDGAPGCLSHQPLQTGLKNILDRAVLHHQELHGALSIDKFSKVDEIPFDFTRRMMSVVVEGPDGQRELLTKGAPEAVFANAPTSKARATSSDGTHPRR